ncbi:hypothetical protein BG015_009302 [Linnemannia schmuckeri]|uniref:Uncharacterized protein n=1 Tax=Linnemannia schmuckeri TaxID=64567 RepID=A0A9P5RW71_9FUNG|nr:hypothetical protein BG015_009302 [Linnemannia schmuckeri]
MHVDTLDLTRLDCTRLGELHLYKNPQDETYNIDLKRQPLKSNPKLKDLLLSGFERGKLEAEHFAKLERVQKLQLNRWSNNEEPALGLLQLMAKTYKLWSSAMWMTLDQLVIQQGEKVI